MNKFKIGDEVVTPKGLQRKLIKTTGPYQSLPVPTISTRNLRKVSKIVNEPSFEPRPHRNRKPPPYLNDDVSDHE